MKRMIRIAFVTVLFLLLPGFFWPWYLDNYPTSQHDTTWATEDCSAAFYIPVDELFDYAECRLDVAEDMSLYIDLGPGVSTINIALQSVVENNAGRMYMESYIEHWWVTSVKPGKYTVRVEETTYFTPGEILTFYCVDGNHLDDPAYLQAEIAKIQREEKKSQWITRGIFAGVVVLVVAIVVLLLRRKRRRRKLG